MGELPFTIDQFLQVFVDYNQAIWPAQVVAYVAGFAVVLLLFKKSTLTNTFINIILGVYWICMGIVYHILFFSEINTAAYIFGSLFILQGVGFLLLIRSDIELGYSYRSDRYGWVGNLFMVYGMLIYPILGYTLGHVYPQAPVFGVAPCPTTIFTFGVLLHSVNKVPLWLIIIPGLWSLIGFTAALKLTIYEDIGLLIVGLIGVILLLLANRKQENLSFV